MEKKWYQSKKFWSAIIPALIALADVIVYQATGSHIPTEGLLAAAATALGYIFMEGGLDAKSMKLKQMIGQASPLQDPLIRDLIQSLIQHHFDFEAASKDLGLHSSDVINKVLTSLADMINPDLADSQDIKNEVARQVVKLYDQESKMIEGSDLARSVMNEA